MAALNIGSTADLRTNQHYRIMLYGANGSGKTHFAGTWPRPVFIVPNLGSNEMRTLANEDFPVIGFGNMRECANQTLALYKAIKASKFVGPYKPRTVVIDNLSTMQTLFEYEIKDSEVTPSMKAKMTWDDWAVIKHNVQQMMYLLHQLDVHVIWIAHAKLVTVTMENGGKKETFTEGGFYLSGDTKNSIPGNCDNILYAEVKDIGLKGSAFYIHGRKYNIWPARVRNNPKAKPFSKIGPDPHYDDLAKILGLPSCAKEEEDDSNYKP